MSFELFGVDVAQLVGDAFNGNTQDITLRKYAANTVDPSDATKVIAGTPTDYAAQGFIASRKAKGNENNNGQQGSSQAKTADTQILIFGALIDGGQVPAEEDVIIIGNEHFTIVTVDSDDTKATYICNCRG